MTIDILGSPAAARPADRAPAGTGEAAARAAVQGTARAPAAAADTAVAVKAPAIAPSLAQVHEAVSRLNQSSQSESQGLEFSVDSDSKRTVVKVIDQNTKEVLRQIPTPEALEIAKALESTSRTGLLIQQTA
jgi:flagellar protein FlaG